MIAQDVKKAWLVTDIGELVNVGVLVGRQAFFKAYAVID
jgi:hypothetical protein